MISNWLLIMIFFRFGFCSPPPHKNGGGGCTGAHGSLPFFLKSYFARDVFLEIFFRVILQGIQNFSGPGISKVSSGALCCCCNIENFQVLGGMFGKLFRFSENLARFVYLKHPFWDSTFCLITDELCFEIISNIKFWKSWYFEYTKLKLRHGSFPGRFSTWLAEKMAERCIGYSIVSAWIKCKIISPLMTSIEMCLLSTRSLNDIAINNTSTINVEF